MKEDLLRKAMREMAARGGKRRLETLTPEQRTEIAKKAGEASGKARAAKKAARGRREVRRPLKRSAVHKGSQCQEPGHFLSISESLAVVEKKAQSSWA
ncbi:MAG: hypothetical protein WBW33_11750 [Bryobacteraceae bacterium]